MNFFTIVLTTIMILFVLFVSITLGKKKPNSEKQLNIEQLHKWAEQNSKKLDFYIRLMFVQIENSVSV